MSNLSKENIKNLFEKQIMELTRQTVTQQADVFDYQLSGGWIR